MKKTRTIVSLLFIIAVLVLQFFGLLDVFENPVEDKLYQTGSKINNNIYVIGIDEETLNELGSFDKFSRDRMADLINKLMEDPESSPAVIALDIAYYAEKDEETDDKLIEACRNAGNVVMVDTVMFGSVVEEGNQAIMVEKPFDELADAIVGSGHSNYQLDSDGVVRHKIGTLNVDGKKEKSFATVVYENYIKKMGLEDNTNERLKEDTAYIVYAGEPRTFYGSVGAGCSFVKVLNGTYSTKSFKDSIVFVGAYATGMQDNYYTSIDKQTQMYGVEIHANIVNQYLNNSYKLELADWALLVPTFIMALLAVLIINITPTKWTIIINLALCAIYVSMTQLFYRLLGVIMPILAPVVAMALTVIVDVVGEYASYAKQKKAIIEKYSKFLPKAVAEQIADEGEEKLKLGGVKKNIAVLFVDIRGFTTLSESLTPEEVVNFLNQYYIITTEAVFKNGGMVDKFVGDETMALFNAPLDLDDYIDKAVMAGLDMINAHDRFNDMLPDSLKDKVWYGVGVHYGDAVVGNLGTTERMDYTAIGDTINTGARLQGQAKANELVISSDVYDIIKSRFLCEHAGAVHLKGKAKDMEIYKVISRL